MNTVTRISLTRHFDDASEAGAWNLRVLAEGVSVAGETIKPLSFKIELDVDGGADVSLEYDAGPEEEK